MSKDDGLTEYEKYIAEHNVTVLPEILKKPDIKSVSDFFYTDLGLSDNQEFNIVNFIINYANHQIKSAKIETNKLIPAILTRTKSQNERKIRAMVISIIKQLVAKGYCLADNDMANFVFLQKRKTSVEGKNSNSIQAKADSIFFQIDDQKRYRTRFPEDEDFHFAKVPPDQRHEINYLDFTNEKIPTLDQFQDKLISIGFRNDSHFYVTHKYIGRLYDIAIAKIRFYMQDETFREVAEQVRYHLNKAQSVSNRRQIDAKTFASLIHDYMFDDPLSSGHIQWLTIVGFIAEYTRDRRELVDLFQAASLVNSYLAHEIDVVKKKESLQKKKEKDIQKVVSTLADTNNLFSVNMIRKIQEHDGKMTLHRKYSEDEFDQLINIMYNKFSNVDTQDTKKIPTLFAFRVANEPYFIHTNKLIEYLIDKNETIKRQFIVKYALIWSQDIKNYNEDNKALLFDSAFEDLLERFIADRFPLEKEIYSRKSWLLFARSKASGRLENKAQSWFSADNELKRFSEILELSRQEMQQTASGFLSLPWNFEIARKIRKIFLQIFSNKRISYTPSSEPSFSPQNNSGEGNKGQELEFIDDEKTDRPPMRETDKGSVQRRGDKNQGGQQGKAGEKRAGTPSKAERDQFKKNQDQALALKSSFLRGQDIDKLLSEYESIWNPTFGDAARKNTKANINAEVVRVVKKLYRGGSIPLDRAKVEELAKQIIKDPAFDQIHKKKEFNAYVEIYILSKFIIPKYKIN